MKHLGIDYGSKRVGTAISDEEGRLAFPVEVLQNKADLFLKIVEKIKNENVGVVVVGESKDLKGVDNTLMDEIRIFVKKLKSEISIPVVYEPEFFTSFQAERMSAKDVSDASAAALILQSYLDKKSKAE